MQSSLETKLFNLNQTEVINQRIPERPLGPVSTYVVMTMPHDLAEVREGRLAASSLAVKADILLGGITEKTLDTTLHNPKKRDLATLDLTILEAGIVHSGAEPSEKLTMLVDTFSTRAERPPVVTYEDLIFTNPLGTDPRTYTSGSVGRSERDFYLTHLLIEDVMTEVNDNVKDTINQLDQQGISALAKAQERLSRIATRFQDTLEPMHQVGTAMPKAHFDEFRIYFQPHPTRELKGASGAFSASIPTFDLLLGGEMIEPEHLQYLKDNEQYFPRGGYKDILDGIAAADQGLTLNALQQRFGVPELTAPLTHMDKILRQLRGKHLGAVARQTPQVYNGGQAGTAGETDAAGFLQRRQRTSHIN